MARSVAVPTLTSKNDAGTTTSRLTSRKKITRSRPITSCSECTRRKQKCSKTWPCTLCLGRKSPQLCHFVNNKKSTTKAKDEGLAEEVKQSVDRDIQEHAGRSEKEKRGIITKGGDQTDEYVLKVDANEMVVGTLYKDSTDGASSRSPNSLPIPLKFSALGHNEIISMMPDRQIVDALIQHFLAQVNWLAEEIHAPTFLSKYQHWWTLPTYNIDTDVQFAILVLRLCINSIQYLPHPTGPAHPSLQTLEGLDDLERSCTEAATKLSELKRSRPNIGRIQHLLFHIVTLLNNGNATESYKALDEAVREGQEIGLYIESRWKDMTEFEMEERRRVFWYLYVWDRFHCTYLGRWPLIPENYHSVSYPSEKPYVVSPLPDAPTQFTDVIFNFRMCRHMVSITAAPSTVGARSDPVLVAKAAETFQGEFVNSCPPCLRFQDPDTQWDNLIPTLQMKRQAFYIMSYGTVVAMHKCFIGPLIESAVPEYAEQMEKHHPMVEMTRVHRRAFANACIKTIETSFDLLKLMGYGQRRWFVLAVVSIEATANLALLITAEHLLEAAVTHGKFLPTLDAETRSQSLEYFQKGLEMHSLLSTRSRLAQKGTHILKSLERRVKGLGIHNRGRSDTSSDLPGIGEESADHRSLTDGTPHQYNISTNTSNVASTRPDSTSMNSFYPGDDMLQTSLPGNEYLDLDWAAICAEGDWSWFFDDQTLSDYGYDSASALP